MTKYTRMEKQRFRIGELARALSVEDYVIRFWEKEFDFRSTRSEGGQRFYSTEDLTEFKKIKELLYNKGFTIAGARHQLRSKYRTERAPQAQSLPHQIKKLKKQLLTLKKLLD